MVANNFNCENSKAVINNLSGYKFLISISMLYMSIMLCNAILTNRYIGTDMFFILGGTLTSPFIFILNDIIAEIYGYKIAKNVIISGFAAQTIFVVICQFIVIAPYPAHFKEAAAYLNILGPNLLRINVGGFIAYMVANLINSFILTRWKILLRGEKFWLRSFFSSTFSEAIYSFIAILMMELNKIPFNDVFKVVIISYLIKATYSLVFAFPLNLFVNIVKKRTGIDVYDVPEKFISFKHLKEKRGV